MIVQGTTFNMCGQMYRRHTNATALFNSPVASALGSESEDPGSSPGRGKALCPWEMREKKMQAPLLGLAKSIYYITWNTFLLFFLYLHFFYHYVSNTLGVAWTGVLFNFFLILI